METFGTKWEASWRKDLSILLFLCISVCSHCLEEDNKLTEVQANLEWTFYQNPSLPGAVFFQCLLTDRNPAASFLDFWKNLFYKPIKSGALPKDWSTASSTLHVGNVEHPGYPLACSQASSKQALEHSEDKSTSKVEKGTMHNLCFYHRYLMSNWIGVFP